MHAGQISRGRKQELQKGLADECVQGKGERPGTESREPRESCMERRRRSRGRKAIWTVRQLCSPAGTVCGQHLGVTAEEPQLCMGKLFISGLFGPCLSARRTMKGHGARREKSVSGVRGTPWGRTRPMHAGVVEAGEQEV